jgi:hypothetical protein
MIAAVRSGDGSIAVASDSQESFAGQKRQVQKLHRRTTGNVFTLLGGSGPSRLLDSFAVQFYEELPNENSTSLSDLNAFTEELLARFHERDVHVYPGADGDKEFRLFLGATLLGSGESDAWTTKHLTLERINTYELVGEEEIAYHTVAQRFFRPSIANYRTASSARCSFRQGRCYGCRWA